MDKGLLGGAVPAAVLGGSASPSVGYTVLLSHTNRGLKLPSVPPIRANGQRKSCGRLLPCVIKCIILRERFTYYISVYTCGAEENPS